MRKVDAFLSRKAQAVWPTAVVFKEEIPAEGALGPRIRFVLERRGQESLDLGGPFGVARQALYALRNAANGKDRS